MEEADMSENPRVRASNDERETYAARVRKAVAEGRLTIDEGDERMLTIYAATYRDELGPLVADLPPDPAAVPAARPEWHMHRGGWRPRPPVGPLFIAAVLVGVWALSGAHFFWPAIPLVFLGLIFVRRLFWWRHWSRSVRSR
jgi:hypothetical protein